MVSYWLKDASGGMAYQCPEVGYLEWRIVTRDTSNLVVSAIDLGADVYNQ